MFKGHGDPHEPLVHLSKRAAIHPVKAWLIRLASFAAALAVCGLVAFLLIDRLKANPGNDWTLPQEITDKTIDKYLQAYKLLTGEDL